MKEEQQKTIHTDAPGFFARKVFGTLVVALIGVVVVWLCGWIVQ